MLAAAALATSHSVRTQTTPLKPVVSVSMADFRAVNPDRAYDALIAEAAEALQPRPGIDPRGHAGGIGVQSDGRVDAPARRASCS